MRFNIDSYPSKKSFSTKSPRSQRHPPISFKKFRKNTAKQKSPKEVQLQKKLDDLNVSFEKVHSELEKYIYRASHDLRAPLVSVLGLINVIKITKKEQPTEQYLQMMEGTIKKLDNTIREIVYNASISRRVIQPETIDIEHYFSVAIQHQKMNNSTCHVNSIISINQREEFVSDSVLVELIIHHLIANAFRFRNRMAERLILKIDVISHKKELKIEVTDNGRGIKEDHLPQIFNMFNRSSSEVAGLGLGLYTVREAVRKLNGSLDVKSLEGEGTTVSLKLPCLKH